MNQPPTDSGDQPSSNQPPQPGNFPPPPPGSYPPPGNFPPPPGNYGPLPGNFPPPPGNYGPPPGNFPPPPGNYGPPPGSYPPPPGYYPPPVPGYPAPGGTSMSIGDGLSWAFKQLGKHIGPLLVATLVYGVIFVVLNSAVSFIARLASSDVVVNTYSDPGSYFYSANMTMGPLGTVIMWLGNLVVLAIAGVIASAYIGGLLDIADGRPVAIGSFFKPRNVGSMIIATLIVGVLTTIGMVLCVVPGLLVSIFTMFTTVALLDRNLPPIDAIKASFEIVKAKFIDCLLVWLMAIAMIAAGALLCGVGLLVAVPVAFLFEIFAFRRITGGGVVPAV